ncbi:MAG: membrane protein insertion efficiency factor YidD [Hyphomicrobiales bacterium]|nr:membrane protein insertion efficiency factor YidD [Hyphomicrobiales bacterium]
MSSGAKFAVKAPIYVYKYAISPYLGPHCRHLPTCSAYAIDAIDMNGAWKGGWLTLSRICRCQPWGTSGYDPPPDLRSATHRFAPWRYGRWAWKASPKHENV